MYIGLILALVSTAVAVSATAYGQSPLRPLSQPTAAELTAALTSMKADSRWPTSATVITMGLAEPAKHDVRAGTAVRTMKAVVYDVSQRATYEFYAQPSTKEVIEVRRVGVVQPMIIPSDMDSAIAILSRNPRWQAALQRRGLSTDDVAVDVWASGIPTTSYTDRMVRAIAFVKDNGINSYARPIEGLAALVNLSKNLVPEVLDRPERPLGNPYPTHVLGDKPSKQIKAPQSLIVRGNDIVWGPWSMTAVLHPREGLTIYDVAFRDGKQQRSIAWRLSMSEMVVPYGDTATTWFWRHAFDVGEYGTGMLAVPLVRGVDVPADAVLLGAPLLTSTGDVIPRKDVVGVHVEDAGLLWKHVDMTTGQHKERKGQRLVVTQTSTVGNYDYMQRWSFAEDGAIDYSVHLTGMLLLKGSFDSVVTENDGQKLAALVGKYVQAPSHQHFFCMRLDLDVDDTSNTVHEVDIVRRPQGSENPFDNVMMADDWEFRFEREARSNHNIDVARSWKITSTNRNELGGPTAYSLHPAASTPTYLGAEHFVRKRAPFLDTAVWVTRYRSEELYAAGDYPNQSTGNDGLSKYVADNASIRNKDVVLWYTFAVTHHARPEDYPIMPVAKAGFRLQPEGFFSRNPTLQRFGP